MKPVTIEAACAELEKIFFPPEQEGYVEVLREELERLNAEVVHLKTQLALAPQAIPESEAMRHHNLKCWPSAFAAVRSGQKHHEVRVNDRDYMPGDEVTLREWDPTTENHVTRGYTNKAVDMVIGHVTPGGTWGLPERLCVFTLLPEAAAMSACHHNRNEYDASPCDHCATEADLRARLAEMTRELEYFRRAWASLGGDECARETAEGAAHSIRARLKNEALEEAAKLAEDAHSKSFGRYLIDGPTHPFEIAKAIRALKSTQEPK